MIGDNLNTDIKLSEKTPDAALVLSGVTNNQDLVNIHSSYNGNQLMNLLNILFQTYHNYLFNIVLIYI